MTNQDEQAGGLKLHEECGHQAMLKNGIVHEGFIDGGSTIRCFMPMGHKFVRHTARIDVGTEVPLIVEWGPAAQKGTPHVCGVGDPFLCDVFECLKKGRPGPRRV